MTSRGPKSGVPDPGVVLFRPVERVVLTASESAAYLGIKNAKSVQRLVDQELLAPLTYGRANVFAKVELDRFITAQLEQERLFKGLPDS